MSATFIKRKPRISIGLGVTGNCNSACKFCYSKSLRGHFIEKNDIVNLLNMFHVKSVNFGVGESILHPNFREIVEMFWDHGSKMSVTSNGSTVIDLEEDYLLMMNDVDLSLDFLSEEKHDFLRGDGSYNKVLKAAEKLASLNIETSFVSCLTKENIDDILPIAELAANFNANLRINRIKTYEKDLIPTHKEYWDFINKLFTNTRIIACSEPIVNARIGHKTLNGGSVCGNKSFRIMPSNEIRGCTYIPNNINLFNILDSEPEKACEIINEYCDCNKTIPTECLDCEQLDICKGGCRAFRWFSDGEERKDYLCYDKNPSQMDVVFGDTKDLVHSEYICTIIVRA